MISGEIKADIVYENDHVLVFRDINPQAPVHVLAIPKRHVSTLNDLGTDDADMVGQLYLAAKEVAVQLGVAEDGYRTVMNCNALAGQSVFHIHLHILAGRVMNWPPG
jgi:histidine triad (HIT) family protein